MTVRTPSTDEMTYGEGEHALDAERLILYRRLASFHSGEVAARYEQRAAEILRRMNEFERRHDRTVTR